MSEEQPLKGPILPPPPPLQALNDAALARWASLDAGKPLQLTITPADMTELFLSLRRAQDAIGFLHASLGSWTNGDLSAANATFIQARDTNIAGMNHLTNFMQAAMSGAKNLA